LSELLYLPLPSLPTASQKSDSILIGSNSNQSNDSEEGLTTGGKWEDEEERRFFEDVQDLKDFVPSSVLGVEGEPEEEESKEVERERVEKEKEEVRKLEEELERLGDSGEQQASDRDKLKESRDEEE
jgi:regulator of nonsense transcripts 2